MATAKNKVIEGFGKGSIIQKFFGSEYLYFTPSNSNRNIKLKKSIISTYDILTEDKVKSASSAIIRGMAGTALLGGVGLLAGLSAKNKSVYLIAIEFKDGNKSLIEIDDNFYKIFIKSNF